MTPTSSTPPGSPWQGWPIGGLQAPPGLVDAVRSATDAVILTHVRPDGDAVGSAVGLARGLAASIGSRPRVFAQGPRTEVFDVVDPDGSWIKSADTAEAVRAVEAAPSIIVVDTSDPSRLEPMDGAFRAATGRKICIDHHVDPKIEGTVAQWIETEACSTAQLVGSVLAALDAPLDSMTATAIYVGIATDTGFFRHGNGLASAFASSAVLVRAGAEPEAIRSGITEKSTIARLRLQGRVMAEAGEAEGGRIVHAVVREADRLAGGVELAELDGFVDALRAIGRSQIQLLFVETSPDRFKVSARSRPPVTVQPVAVKFGGGGHARAAGLRVEGTADEAVRAVVRAMAAQLTE